MASTKFFFGEVLQKSLKVWVKCDYFEALHIEMHVHTSNLNTAQKHLCLHIEFQTLGEIYMYKFLTHLMTSKLN